MRPIEKYTNEIPQEIRQLIAALDNPIRQAILVLLSECGELSFTEIQKTLNLDKLTLNFHLKKLFSSALIDHYFKHKLGNPTYSFYCITPLGKRVLASLNEALMPPTDKKIS